VLHSGNYGDTVCIQSAVVCPVPPNCKFTGLLLSCVECCMFVVYLLTFVTWFWEFVHHLCQEKVLTSLGSIYIPAVRLKCMLLELKRHSQSAVCAYSLKAQCCHLEIQSATSVSLLSIRSYQRQV
jgi:hypothetical protein